MKIDIEAIKKELTNAGVSLGHSNPDTFISTGNYSLNYIISGTFRKAIPNRRQVMLCGPSGAGKSLLAWNIAKNAQDIGYHVFGIDTEHAIDTSYLTKIGLNQDVEHFTPINVSSIEGCAVATAAIFRTTKPEDKICIVIDSIGNIDTTDSLQQFDEKGTLKNDMGIKSKKIKQLLRDINVHSGARDVFMIVCNHVYMNQDPMNGKGKYIISGGPSVEFIPSISVLVDKKKLKDDSDKNAQILGVRITAEILKSRFFRFAGKTEFDVPYDTGIDKLSGFMEFAVDAGLIQQAGAWYSFIDKEGKQHKFYAKDLDKHIEAILDIADENIIEAEEAEEESPV